MNNQIGINNEIEYTNNNNNNKPSVELKGRLNYF